MFRRDAAIHKIRFIPVKNILSLRDDEFVQANPSSTYRGKDLAQQQIQGGMVNPSSTFRGKDLAQQQIQGGMVNPSSTFRGKDLAQQQIQGGRALD